MVSSLLMLGCSLCGVACPCLALSYESSYLQPIRKNSFTSNVVIDGITLSYINNFEGEHYLVIEDKPDTDPFLYIHGNNFFTNSVYSSTNLVFDEYIAHCLGLYDGTGYYSEYANELYGPVYSYFLYGNEYFLICAEVYYTSSDIYQWRSFEIELYEDSLVVTEAHYGWECFADHDTLLQSGYLDLGNIFHNPYITADVLTALNENMLVPIPSPSSIPSGSDIVGDIVDILVSGITGIGSGIAGGINSFVTALAIGSNNDLSVFMVFVMVFAAIGLGIGLTRHIFGWIESLSGRR